MVMGVQCVVVVVVVVVVVRSKQPRYEISTLERGRSMGSR
jgi:hypothetical protein